MATISGGNMFLAPGEIITKCTIQEGMHVADLGCGKLGFFSLPIAKMVGPRGQVYAVDIVKMALQNMFKLSKLHGVKNIKPVWSDLEVYKATQIPEKSLDRALLINVLFQSEKPGEIIREAARLIKKGGRLIIVDWKKVAVPFGPPLEQREDPEELINIAKKYKLTIVKEMDVGEYHFGLVFEK